MGRAFTPEQSAYVLSPEFSVVGYAERWPHDDRPFESLTRHRRRYGVGGPVGLTPKSDDPKVSWNKSEIDFHWTDILGPLDELQQIAKRSSGAQDVATIRIKTDEPIPVVFISDYHIGSWGTSARDLYTNITRLREMGLRIAILGDMLQMSIRLRGVLEVSDNILPPRMQHLAWESLLDDLSHLILWGTWCNHAVQREEDATGFSYHAELFRERFVYHSGIGHIDLEVGTDDDYQTYRIASSHRFRGNTSASPLAGQKKYMRLQGIDRELAVAGDSHCPAMECYYDGPLARIALNCGSLQADSGYAKRYFSPYSHDDMPVVVFHPDEHVMVPYSSLDRYQKVVS
jgi:hypothetical protein